MTQPANDAAPDGPAANGSLADYALVTTRGRRFPEDAHPWRTDFQRDRDRIVHSRAFRRLEYKTQAFVTGISDYFRTRLTHTIEVAGIARTIARALRLNEDLAETIALAHDLGHPPFGHCGERALNELMAAHGGFDHNQQALRIVDLIEIKYPGFPGLNLIRETRAGLVKHRGGGCQLDGEPLPPLLALEAQVADVADDLTYYSHDLDDGIYAELLQEADLQGLGIWALAAARGRSHGVTPADACYYPYLIRNLIDLLVADVITTSQERLTAARVHDPAAAEHQPQPLVDFSPAFRAHCDELRQFLFARVYWHESVTRDNDTAVQAARELFGFFCAHPEQLGRKAQGRLAAVGLERTVADYIAGMTDRYAIQQYEQYLGTFPRG